MVFLTQAALARSRDAVRLEGEIADIRARLQPLASASKTDAAGDPQASAVAHLTGWELVKVQTAFSLLLVALLELGSSLGLFISLNHGELSAAVRDHKAAHVATSPATAPVRAKPAKPELVVVPPAAPAPVLAISPPVAAMAAQPTGEVERFAYAKVEAFPGQSLALDALYAAYRQWCRAEGCEALARTNSRPSSLSSRRSSASRTRNAAGRCSARTWLSHRDAARREAGRA